MISQGSYLLGEFVALCGKYTASERMGIGDKTPLLTLAPDSRPRLPFIHSSSNLTSFLGMC